MEQDPAEAVRMEWHEREAAEDAMLRQVKDVAQRIARRVRNVLGESEADEVLAEIRDETDKPVTK